MDILLVAAGGALGAMARYLFGSISFDMVYPMGTFLTNLIGAFAIGLAVGLAEQGRLSDESLLFIRTGVCGGFTTFSTFSLEAVTFFSSSRHTLGVMYILFSIGCCLAGVVLGKFCISYMFGRV